MANILLVDDMDGIRSTLGTILKGRGHQVTEAKNGADGIQKASTQSFDVVLTDIVMPGTDGSQLIVELKQRHPKLPIIAMSGGTDGISGDRMLELAAQRADIMLPKPFARDDLLSAITRLCSVANPV